MNTNQNAGPKPGQSRQIPDEVLAQVLAEHEARLNAIAAQQIQRAIMIEYFSNLLDEAVPDFVMDDDDFSEESSEIVETEVNETTSEEQSS